MSRRSAARSARRSAGRPTEDPRTRIRTVARPGRPGRGRRPGRTAVGRSVPFAESVSPLLRTLAGYAWRILAVGAVVYAVFAALGRFHEIGVAVFLGLVVTAMLRPVADVLDRWLPRPLAVACVLIGSIILFLGALAFVGGTVAAEWNSLVAEFRSGLGRIQTWLEQPPLRLSPDALSGAQERIGAYLSSHRAALLSTAVSEAGRVVSIFTVAVLSLFCSVFFIHSGDRHWRWFCAQFPPRARDRMAVAGGAAWRTLTGYTHGIVLVAGTNAILVGFALYALGVPLAVPLALLEFFAAFVPLIGSPVALGVATVVALAARGPLVAGLVLVLIVVIGQIEGHLLHPLVMSWAVRLHPVVVALSVIAGAIAAGVVGAVVAVPLVSVAWAVRLALDTRRAPV
ncbi:AI-2E family transporter [Streptomyces sp. ISL-87]|uniref:AI-2E family transporter n=1 Tax=Streptomyces sp. ISL-87 TaxID=2819188 RepID=UPI001BE6FE9A|nr:AI-2E family transporter [Streptomyces sp. ISL-87]MBT2406202.1 AI-2E family transporter [Streptomyces sp. ISL-21]MBT2609502.1 AI-2E family transporter [Streptomyces sp. ISL-87]